MDDKAVAWLRQQIEGDRATAAEAIDPGYSGEWFMGDKWNVYRAEDEARFDEDYQGEENRLVLFGNCKPESEHIAVHDPRDKLADCEAKLAIISACLPSEADERAVEDGSISAEEYASAEAVGALMLRLLATAYRHRPGYAEHWPG